MVITPIQVSNTIEQVVIEIVFTDWKYSIYLQHYSSSDLFVTYVWIWVKQSSSSYGPKPYILLQPMAIYARAIQSAHKTNWELS
jgi:hypothetical protein